MMKGDDSQNQKLGKKKLSLEDEESTGKVELPEISGSPDSDSVKKLEESSNTANPEELLRREIEKLKSEALYQRAEFENTKKRILRDQDHAMKFANEKLLKEVVGIMDMLRRATTHGDALKQKSPESKKFVEGIEMTEKELTHLLDRFGVEFVGKVGELFDPSRHEAISEIPVGEGDRDKIQEVLSLGCLLHGRLIKPSQVVVGKALAKSTPSVDE